MKSKGERATYHVLVAMVGESHNQLDEVHQVPHALASGADTQTAYFSASVAGVVTHKKLGHLH